MISTTPFSQAAKLLLTKVITLPTRVFSFPIHIALPWLTVHFEIKVGL